jgi:hypothetical protein
MTISRLVSVTSRDEVAQQLLPLRWRGGRRMPDRRDMLGQPENALSFLGRDEESGGLGQCEILALHLLHFPQLLIPVAFQEALHEPIVRIDGDIATTGQISLILRPLQPELPLPIQLAPRGPPADRCHRPAWFDRSSQPGAHGLV